MKRRGQWLWGVGVVMAWVLTPSAARAGSWKRLGGRVRKVSKTAVAKKMRADGLKHPGDLLNHRYLVRLAISATGRGPANHSEVVVRFQGLPKKVLAKAWSGGRAKNRAQLGGYSTCKLPKVHGPVHSVGRVCGTKYNGMGFVDVTNVFTERNILFTHDPTRPKKGNTIVWFASDTPQRKLWYYVLPGARGVAFGFGRIRANQYELPMGPVGEPSVPPPPDADTHHSGGSGTVSFGNQQPSRVVPPVGRTPIGQAPTRSVVVPVPRRTAAQAVAGWNAAGSPRQLDRRLIERRMRADGVRAPNLLLAHPYVVRLSISSMSGYAEVELKGMRRAARAFGNAWVSPKERSRVEFGRAGRCRRRKGTGWPAWAHWCPIHFNGLGWRDLTGSWNGGRLLVTFGPVEGAASGLVVWAAYARPQSNLAYRVRWYGGKGVARVVQFSSLSGGQPGARPPAQKRVPQTVDPWGGPRRTTPRVWKPIRAPLTTWPLWRVLGRMQADRVVGSRALVAYPYVVRIALRRTGGGTGRRSEIGFWFKSPVALALGFGQADSPEMGRAQIGTLRSCRAGRYRFLPRGWRTCPLQFNNLGWRNLTSAVRNRKKILIINQPARAYRANTILYLAFASDPGPILVRRYRRAGAYTLGVGRLQVMRVRVASRSVQQPQRQPHPDPVQPRDTYPGEGPGPSGPPSGDPAGPPVY
ncbi:MAG: hypothetical protein J7M25_10575 [Deltaproteobacteria bacterium]|nr:hypothetical protein [Deltaproteobacteria bacterium]